MSLSLSVSRHPAVRASDEVEALPSAPWLAVVSDNVQSLRYGVVQIVVHDSKVVQVERTERTRFGVPQSTTPER
jgi:hypothetical protein